MGVSTSGGHVPHSPGTSECTTRDRDCAHPDDHGRVTVAVVICIGLDVGREHDPAALAVLVSTDTPSPSHRPTWSILDVGNVARGTDYTDLVEMVTELHDEFVAAGYTTTLTIDATGIGAAVVEMAQKRIPEQRVYAVTIGSGMTLVSHGDRITVGKHRLTEALQVAVEQSRISVDDGASPDGVRELNEQMRSFSSKPGRRPGYQRHEAARGHDDLVLAVELALWTGDSMADQAAGVQT